MPLGTQFSIAKTIGIIETERIGIRIINKGESSEKIVITTSGKIYWLELGNPDGGMEHILYPRLDFEGFTNLNSHPRGHFQDFYNLGYKTKEQIAELILDTLRTKEYISIRGDKGNLLVFKFVRNDGSHWYLAVAVGFNGYIVSAYQYNQQQGDNLYKE